MFDNKKILITGHSGFKGSWLTKILSMKSNAKLYGFSTMSDDYKLYKILNVRSLLQDYDIGNVSDFYDIYNVIHYVQPDIIFHLAAQPLVRDSYECPLDTFNINAGGTANLLEAVRQLNKKCAVICITTDKVYENNESGAQFKETDPLGGYDPYSASKAAAEIVIDSYRKSFFNHSNYGADHLVQLASARAGNVIGGGDFSKDRIVPDIYRAMKTNGSNIELRNPSAIRPWQHVLEPLDGYIKLAQKMYDEEDKHSIWSSAWNFGPNKNSFKTVKYIAQKAIKIFNVGRILCNANISNKHEAGILMLNSEKANNVLDWNPKWNVDKALSKTFEWYKLMLDKEPRKKLVKAIENQIEEYYGK